jgi:ribosome-associated protein
MKVKLKRVKKINRLSAPEKVEITGPFIKLDALLKFAALAETGGEAKFMIQEGGVLVNGTVCTQRGRKIYPGDLVQMDRKQVTVVAREEVADNNDC